MEFKRHSVSPSYIFTSLGHINNNCGFIVVESTSDEFIFVENACYIIEFISSIWTYKNILWVVKNYITTIRFNDLNLRKHKLLKKHTLLLY